MKNWKTFAGILIAGVSVLGISHPASAAPPTAYSVNWQNMQPGLANTSPVVFSITPADSRSQRFRIDSTYSSLITAAERTSGVVNVVGGKCKNVVITTTASLTGATCDILGSFIVLNLAASTTASVSFTVPAGAIVASPTATDTVTWSTAYTTNGGSSWITGDTENAAFDNFPSRAATPATQSVSGTVGTAISAVSVTPVNMYGPFTFSVSPALPNGLVLNTTTGDVSGTPTSALSATNYVVSIQSASAGSSTSTLSISIAAATDSAVPATDLAKTGASSSALISAGVLFVAAIGLGSLLLLVSRKRTELQG